MKDWFTQQTPDPHVQLKGCIVRSVEPLVLLISTGCWPLPCYSTRWVLKSERFGASITNSVGSRSYIELRWWLPVCYILSLEPKPFIFRGYNLYLKALKPHFSMGCWGPKVAMYTCRDGREQKKKQACKLQKHPGQCQYQSVNSCSFRNEISVVSSGVSCRSVWCSVTPNCMNVVTHRIHVWYNIYYIYHMNQPNVCKYTIYCKYTIHGWYGLYHTWLVWVEIFKNQLKVVGKYHYYTWMLWVIEVEFFYSHIMDPSFITFPPIFVGSLYPKNSPTCPESRIIRRIDGVNIPGPQVIGFIWCNQYING